MGSAGKNVEAGFVLESNPGRRHADSERGRNPRFQKRLIGKVLGRLKRVSNGLPVSQRRTQTKKRSGVHSVGKGKE
jgi:hypothetical protein